MRDEGAGTVLAMALMAFISGITLIVFTASHAIVNQVRLNALAENTSIAAADALRGLVAGAPCDVAKSMAPVRSCVILGSDVLIELEQSGITAKSRAGEPG